MAADRLAPSALPEGESGSTKIRLRFRKGGDLRFVSHHDLMHCFERMLRRSGLPFVTTQGFNPHPRIVFPLSLALGITGCREVVEIELAGSWPPHAVSDRLRSHAPPGLDIIEVRVIDRKTRGQARHATYRAALPQSLNVTELEESLTRLLASETLCIERTRPQRKRLDIRPYVNSLRRVGAFLEMDIWITPNGTVRPEEILQALGLAETLAADTALERTDLQLVDEIEGLEPARIPAASSGPSARDSRPTYPECESKTSGAPKHKHATPLIPGPLSFDS